MKLFDVYTLFDITPASAKGAIVKDIHGNSYLDLYGGHAVISIGHSHPHYIKKVKEQLEQIGFYSNSVQIPLQQELAGKLGSLSGYNDHQLFLCNSGAEANENALKLASFHTGRKKVIAFSKSFHGRTSLSVEATDDPSIQAPVNISGNVQILPFNDIEALTLAMNDEIAAVIVEGIQGVGGVNVPDHDFLRSIRRLCDSNGALMILDEVQSGYGRSGKFFAHQYSGVIPDIISIAKGMGNGFPVGGILISPSIAPKQGMLGTTFGGNYLACAAGIAVLDIIKEENLIDKAATTGFYIKEQLSGFKGIRKFHGIGLMIGIELDQPCAAVRKRLLYDHKIFTGSSSNKNILRILPPLNLESQQADIFINALHSVINSSTGAGQ
jgi:acetylornithine/N-succinyldiaminopimelate aminotransferase